METLHLSREHTTMKLLEKVDAILADLDMKHSASVQATKQTFFEVCTVGVKSPVPGHWRDSLGSSSVLILLDCSRDLSIDEKTMEIAALVRSMVFDSVLVCILPVDPEMSLEVRKYQNCCWMLQWYNLQYEM